MPVAFGWIFVHVGCPLQFNMNQILAKKSTIFWFQFWAPVLVPKTGTALLSFLLAVPILGTKSGPSFWDPNWSQKCPERAPSVHGKRTPSARAYIIQGARALCCESHVESAKRHTPSAFLIRLLLCRRLICPFLRSASDSRRRSRKGVPVATMGELRTRRHIDGCCFQAPL